MAIYIEIKKIESINDIHYYKVKTEDFKQPAPFIIGIDNKEKKIYVYKKEINSAPDFSISLEKPDLNDIHNLIAPRLLTCVFVKALQAFKDQKYSEYISYAA